MITEIRVRSILEAGWLHLMPSRCVRSFQIC